MDRLEGDRLWDRWHEAADPAAELDAACDAADKWLKVKSLPRSR